MSRNVRRSRGKFGLATGLLFCLGFTSAAHGGVVHDESIGGDLSNNYQAPTQVVLTEGTNSLIGAMGGFVLDDYLEYVSFEIQPGYQLSGLVLADYGGFDPVSFISVQEGSAFTFDPNDAFSNIGNLLGWAHFGPGEGHVDGTDILNVIGMGDGAIGFSAPLSSSTYTFWIQQTGGETTYQLDFIVTAVPEPVASSVLGLGVLGLGIMARKYKRQNPK